MKKQILLQIGILFLFILSAFSQRTESPYFLLPGDLKAESFPLLSTTVDAIINGPIANVSVVQTYKNQGDISIEAVYVFPASTRAAVHHMEMRVGERIITAEVMEKQKAQSGYEKAKESGKRASLLEQHRPNVFQMHVANILPGEEIAVTMKYTEFLLPEKQIYSFVFPTVVGPRYNGEIREKGRAAFASIPYTKAGILPKSSLNISVELRTPIPVADVSSPSHLTRTTLSAENHPKIQLDPIEIMGGNRDYILNFTLSGNEIQSGVMTYTDGEENYFLCQLEPPSMSNSIEIVPREYIFILDVSGSMSGFPINTSKVLMKNLLSKLRPTDKFNILFFASSANMLHKESVEATASNICQAFAIFNKRQAGGVTNLLYAINTALNIPKNDSYSRSFIILTDGYVTVEEATFNRIQEKLQRANFFAFGIGTSVNRFIIEGIAHVGRGEPFILTDPSKATEVSERFQQYIETPVLTGITISGKDIEILGTIPNQIPDLMGLRPIYCFGKYKATSSAKLFICGRRGNRSFNTALEVPPPDSLNSALKYLWAREKIRFLADFNRVNRTKERINEITSLGLKYNLLTEHTSFLAVDNEIAVKKGENTVRIVQPSPLPQGVPNSAVGFELTIPAIVDTGRSNEILIKGTVMCENEELGQVLDAIIEVIIKQFEPEYTKSLLDKKYIFILHPNGEIRSMESNPFITKEFLDALNKAMKSLDIVFEKEEEFIISFKAKSFGL